MNGVVPSMVDRTAARRSVRTRVGREVLATAYVALIIASITTSGLVSVVEAPSAPVSPAWTAHVHSAPDPAITNSAAIGMAGATQEVPTGATTLSFSLGPSAVDPVDDPPDGSAPPYVVGLAGSAVGQVTGVGAGRAGRAPRGDGVLGGLVARVGARRLARSLTCHHARTGVLAHAAIAARVRAGDQVGAVPYGYRRGEGPGQRMVVDESTAAVVVQIFTWRATSRIGATRIAGRLDAGPGRYPPPLDTRGARRRWTRGLVRHILANPVDTGRRVWGRTHQGRPVPVAGWVASAPNAHPRLVDDLTFDAAQRPLSGGRGFVVMGISGRNHSDAGLASTISGPSSAVAARASRRHEAGEST